MLRSFKSRGGLVSVFALLGASALCAQVGGAAKVVAMSGRVSVMRGSAPWALNDGDAVQPQEIIRTGPDGYAQFRVADGSTFDVYPNSQVVFRANASDWKDMLDVMLGKIRVKIEHFGTIPNHNSVRTPTAVIAVRGTIFDVSIEDDDATTMVLCEEGRVEVYHLTQPGKSRFLDPGESIEVFKNQPIARSVVDHGVMMQRLARAASDALNQLLLHRASTAGSSAGSGSSGGASGDKGGTPTPTGGGGPPPPPPPH